MKKLKIVVFMLLLFMFPLSIQAEETQTLTPGTYLVTFTYYDEVNDKTISNQVYMTLTGTDRDLPKDEIDELIKNPDIKIEKVSDIVLEAYDFSVKNRNLKSFDDSKILELSGAKAYDARTGSVLPIKIIETKVISENEISYKIETNDKINKVITGRNLRDGLDNGLINWDRNTIHHQDDAFMRYSFFNLSLLFVVIIPLILLAILFVIYIRSKRKVEKTLYEETQKNASADD